MIEFKFPEIPASVNGLYVSRGARRFLSSKGKKFKNSFISKRGGASLSSLMSFPADPQLPYVLELWFFIPPEKLYNKGYGTDRRVKSPYKDMDVSNLVKLAEDSIAELLGLRDRNNFTVIAHKREGDGTLVARLSPLNMEEDPYAVDRRAPGGAEEH